MTRPFLLALIALFMFGGCDCETGPTYDSEYRRFYGCRDGYRRTYYEFGVPDSVRADSSGTRFIYYHGRFRLSGGGGCESRRWEVRRDENAE